MSNDRTSVTLPVVGALGGIVVQVLSQAQGPEQLVSQGAPWFTDVTKVFSRRPLAARGYRGPLSELLQMQAGFIPVRLHGGEFSGPPLFRGRAGSFLPGSHT